VALGCGRRGSRGSAVGLGRGRDWLLPPRKMHVPTIRPHAAAQVLVDQLREKCLEERGDAAPAAPNGSSSGQAPAAGPAAAAAPAPAPPASSGQQAPEEWSVDPGRPCGGERPLLMFDRWRKLLRSFFSDKKGTFDISKVGRGAARKAPPLETRRP
jgi:hypothetical protein